MNALFTSEQLANAYHDACIAELQALKPGNVHLFADGHGMTVQDFIKSAVASSAVIARPHLSVGQRIFDAVDATQKVVGLNTNLGLILLCAPLIHSALQYDSALQGDADFSLRQNLTLTLEQLDITDGRLSAKAILLANPAGLGVVDEHDVHEEVEVTLLEMMHSVKHKDRIAMQYASEYNDIFEFGVLRYQEAMAKWNNQAWATTALYIGYLSRFLDTHIVRKYGEAVAKTIMFEAQEVEAQYWAAENPKLIQKKLLAWDASLKKRKINPGTSADLTVATLLAVSLLK